MDAPADSALVPLWELVAELAPLGDPELAELALAGTVVDELTLDLPIELDVTAVEDGRVELLGAPPTQQVETSVLPVFHQLRLRAVADHAG